MINNTTFESFVRTLLKAWQRGETKIRVSIVIALILLISAFIVIAMHDPIAILEKNFAKTLTIVLGGVSAILFFGVAAYQGLIEEEAQQKRFETVEERVREHPEKPQFAWDLARTKLESYLDRNLSQVRSIFWLTLIVMLCGFGFVLFGLLKAFDTPDNLPITIVASASGILISFIGGSFLLIYRSILAQSREYVNVLERINAVGMAVQVIASIPEENSELKHQTTAELAKQLLNLYAVNAASSISSSAPKG